jgi:hypothetical protein
MRGYYWNLERFPQAAAQFGARLISDRGLSVAEAQLAFVALQMLAGPEREPCSCEIAAGSWA